MNAELVLLGSQPGGARADLRPCKFRAVLLIDRGIGEATGGLILHLSHTIALRRAVYRESSLMRASLVHVEQVGALKHYRLTAPASLQPRKLSRFDQSTLYILTSSPGLRFG